MPYEMYTKPPNLGHPLTKDEAGYVAKGPFGCKNCGWFESSKSTGLANCKVIGEDVDAGACCDYWSEKDAPQGVGRVKAEYVFIPGSKYRCDECRFYVAGKGDTGTCSPVKGSINAGGSCNKWMPFPQKIDELNLKESWMAVDLVEQLREAAASAVREAGLSTAFSDGSERGAAQSSGKFPPSRDEENGGQTTTPRDPGATGGATAEITQRGAPLSAGRAAFSTGGPAPTDFAVGYNASDGNRAAGSLNPPSEHVSDDRSAYSTPGPPEHVRQALADGRMTVGEALLECIGPPVRCATCDHIQESHPNDGTCVWCEPKGSEHKFTTEKDLSGIVLRGPMIGTVRESHLRMFDDSEKALILLDEFREAVYGDHGDEPGGHSTHGMIGAAKDRADDYNSHSVAAHHATVRAYMSGTKADHNVAAAAHDMACGAACKAGEDYPDKNPVGNSFKAADNYHQMQSKAHKAAAAAIKVGRGHPSGGMY